MYQGVNTCNMHTFVKLSMGHYLLRQAFKWPHECIPCREFERTEIRDRQAQAELSTEPLSNLTLTVSLWQRL